MTNRQSHPIFWIVRLLALIAAGIAIYLAISSVSQAGLAGCGEGSDCDDVLASRWSKWMGVPVAFGAIAIYLSIFGVSFAAGRKSVRLWLVGLSVAAAGAAIWFVAVQLGVMKRVCPYCMAVHACGVLIAGLVLIECLVPRRSMQNHVSARVAALRPRQLWIPAALSLLAVAGLIAGQVLGPKPQRPIVLIGGGPTTTQRSVQASTGASTRASSNVSTTQTAVDPRNVKPAPLPTFHLGGRFVEIDPKAFPMLGPATAPHLIAVMGDYTCPHCRVLHGLLNKVRLRYAGQVALVMLPVPMNSQCNPRIRQTHIRHTNACELWRIALAVWRADPRAYAELDDWLFQPETARLPGDARVLAARLVGRDQLVQLETDPWVEQSISKGVAIYGAGGGGQIPRLIFTKEFPAGQIGSDKDLFDVLERELGLRPEK